MMERQVNRQISEQWDRFMALAKSIHYGRMEQIEFKDGQPRFVRVTYDFKMDDVADMQKKFDELKTIAL